MQHFFYGMIIIIAITMGALLVSDLAIIDYYNKETDSAIINSVTEGFSSLSLENISERGQMQSREDRSININSEVATEKVRESLIKNLFLNESLLPLSDSFILDREVVKIVRINIIKASMIPYDFNSEIIYEESIIVELALPIKLSFAKHNKFLIVRKVVSLETFLTINEQ